MEEKQKQKSRAGKYFSARKNGQGGYFSKFSLSVSENESTEGIEGKEEQKKAMKVGSSDALHVSGPSLLFLAIRL